MFTDGQAKARAAITAGGGTICLGKAFEDGFLAIFGNPNPRILNGESDGGMPRLIQEWFGADHDLALVGKFNGITDQVDQDLPQSSRVAA